MNNITTRGHERIKREWLPKRNGDYFEAHKTAMKDISRECNNKTGFYTSNYIGDNHGTKVMQMLKLYNPEIISL